MLQTISTKTYIAMTETVRSGIKRFARDERGVTAIEYGLIAVAIAALIIFVFYSNDGFIAKLKGKFGDLATTVNAVATTNGQ